MMMTTLGRRDASFAAARAPTAVRPITKSSAMKATFMAAGRYDLWGVPASLRHVASAAAALRASLRSIGYPEVRLRAGRFIFGAATWAAVAVATVVSRAARPGRRRSYALQAAGAVGAAGFGRRPVDRRRSRVAGRVGRGRPGGAAALVLCQAGAPRPACGEGRGVGPQPDRQLHPRPPRE